MNEPLIYQKLLVYIRMMRTSRRMSQLEMAKLLGMKQSNYAKMENNQLDMKVSVLLKIINVFELNNLTVTTKYKQIIERKEIHDDFKITSTTSDVTNLFEKDQFLLTLINEISKKS